MTFKRKFLLTQSLLSLYNRPFFVLLPWRYMFGLSWSVGFARYSQISMNNAFLWLDFFTWSGKVDQSFTLWRSVYSLACGLLCGSACGFFAHSSAYGSVYCSWFLHLIFSFSLCCSFFCVWFQAGGWPQWAVDQYVLVAKTPAFYALDNYFCH